MNIHKCKDVTFASNNFYKVAMSQRHIYGVNRKRLYQMVNRARSSVGLPPLSPNIGINFLIKGCKS